MDCFQVKVLERAKRNRLSAAWLVTAQVVLLGIEVSPTQVYPEGVVREIIDDTTVRAVTRK